MRDITLPQGNNVLQIILAPVPLAPELSLVLELEPATESPSPGVIYAGGGMVIHGIVTNIGNYQGIYYMKWYVNDELIYSYNHVLNPGNTHDNSQRYAAMDIGTYNVRVTVDTVEATGSFSAIEAPVGEPNISLWFKVLASTIYPGQNPELEIRPYNDGTAAGSYSYTLYLDGAVVDSKSGTLGVGEMDFLMWRGAVVTVGTHELHIVMNWDGHTTEDRESFKVIERPTGEGTVWGCVYDRYTEVPIRATLTISGIGTISLDSACCYEITLDAGSWDFRCEAPGYRTMLWPITVRVGDRIKRSFAMTPL